MTPITALEVIPNGHHELEPAMFEAYLEKHLTSDLVLRVLEGVLVEENSSYAPIDFEQALKDLQQRDGGRYLLLKTLLEAYAIKEGQVMLDPKMVSASYKQRMKELEYLRSLSRFRRFFYRVTQAVIGLMSEKTETEAIQEAIQITGEVQIAREELAVLEAKKAKVTQDSNEMEIRTSHERRKILQQADDLAAKKTEAIYKEAHDGVFKERQKLHEEFTSTYKMVTDLREELHRLKLQRQEVNSQRFTGYQGYQAYQGYQPSSSRDDPWSRSPSASLSPSPSASLSPSPSDSASPSPSDDGEDDF